MNISKLETPTEQFKWISHRALNSRFKYIKLKINYIIFMPHSTLNKCVCINSRVRQPFLPLKHWWIYELKCALEMSYAPDICRKFRLETACNSFTKLTEWNQLLWPRKHALNAWNEKNCKFTSFAGEKSCLDQILVWNLISLLYWLRSQRWKKWKKCRWKRQSILSKPFVIKYVAFQSHRFVTLEILQCFFVKETWNRPKTIYNIIE